MIRIEVTQEEEQKYPALTIMRRRAEWILRDFGHVENHLKGLQKDLDEQEENITTIDNPEGKVDKEKLLKVETERVSVLERQVEQLKSFFERE